MFQKLVNSGHSITNTLYIPSILLILERSCHLCKTLLRNHNIQRFFISNRQSIFPSFKKCFKINAVLAFRHKTESSLSANTGRSLVTSFNMVVCKTFYAYESFVFFNFRPASTWSPLYPVM